MIRIGAFIVAAFLVVLMGVMVGLTLKRIEGATRQNELSMGFVPQLAGLKFPTDKFKS